MSDLVERLRAYSDQLGGITDEAADAIVLWRSIAESLMNATVSKMQGFAPVVAESDIEKRLSEVESWIDRRESYESEQREYGPE